MNDFIEENPNPHAKIGFVIFYPFQFYVFKNVYRHLEDEAEFIVDGGQFFPMPPPQNIIQDCAAVLMKNKVRFRVLHVKDYYSSAGLSRFFSPYGVLVSLWQAGCVNLPCNEKKRKVRMNYGAGKALSMFSTIHRKWDLYLCLGQYVHEIMKLFTWSVVVGYPKFDDWFNDVVDETAIATIRSRLDPNKKTLLYLPTHSDLSSIDELANELKAATRDNNVIVKLHYYTPREEPELMEKLRHPQIFLCQDDIDLLPLLKVADVVVSDNSSAIFDAILADRPTIVTDFLSKDYLDREHKKGKQFRFRPPEGALTYSQSIEQKIKKDGSVIAIKNPEELHEAITRALVDGGLFRGAREKLRKELFAFSDGKCGKRAALAIRNLLEAKELPEKPVLYHVVEAEFIALRAREAFSQKADSNRDGPNALMPFYFDISKIKALPPLQKILTVIKMFF